MCPLKKDISTLENASGGWRRRFSGLVREFPPSYFAMAMATGTLSIAAHLLGIPFVAHVLFVVNVVAYVVLMGLNVCRVVSYPREFFADMISHQVGPGFFTFVASSCVLGSQFVIIYERIGIAAVLLAFAAVMWIGLTYAIFTAFTIKESKPELVDGISGAWLLSVVATQAVAVLMALLAAHWPQPFRLELNFIALSMWLWGGMLYIWMISLIFYRYTFFRFSPGDLSPPYWINMGAMAISALAGTRLIQNSGDAPFLMSLLPFLKGFTVFYWATGTWWIPMLFILGIWRHIFKGYPLKYDPQYWGAVFPLAMYTVSTYALANVLGLDFLFVLPKVFICVAFLAWAGAFWGLLKRILFHLRGVS